MTAPSKIVAASDLHLGQRGQESTIVQYSVLGQITQPTRGAVTQDARRRFADTLHSFAGGDPLTFVAVGDLIDLSLATFEQALEDLTALFRMVPEVTELVWVVGNHDHHIWSIHENYKWAIEPMLAGDEPAPQGIYRPTPPRGELHTPLTVYLKRRCPHIERVTIAYPSYEHTLQDRTGELALYCTHGHLFGGLYTMLSELFREHIAQVPQDRAAATVNLAVIESVYWLLGQTGEGLGADGLLEQLYLDLERSDHSRIDPLLTKIARPRLPRWLDWSQFTRRHAIEAFVWGAKKLLHEAIPVVRSHESVDRHILVGHMRDQLHQWLVETPSWSADRRTLVMYGHTHEPDQWMIPNTRTMSYNLGSWLIEPTADHSYIKAPGRLLLVDPEGVELEKIDVPPPAAELARASSVQEPISA